MGTFGKNIQQLLTGNNLERLPHVFLGKAMTEFAQGGLTSASWETAVPTSKHNTAEGIAGTGGRISKNR